MSTKKARDLVVGDIFRLHIYGEVLAVSRVAEDKRVKIKIELENQGRRANTGTLPWFSDRYASTGALEFTDAGYVLEFICRPSRTFHVYGDDDWDDDGNGIEPAPLSPRKLINA